MTEVVIIGTIAMLAYSATIAWCLWQIDKDQDKGE